MTTRATAPNTRLTHTPHRKRIPKGARAATPRMLPRLTIRDRATAAMKTPREQSTAGGDNTRSAPRAVATPLPPRNPNHGMNTCPRIAARAAAREPTARECGPPTTPGPLPWPRPAKDGHPRAVPGCGEDWWPGIPTHLQKVHSHGLPRNHEKGIEPERKAAARITAVSVPSFSGPGSWEPPSGPAPCGMRSRGISCSCRAPGPAW